jgi:dienelactone hydrolase
MKQNLIAASISVAVVALSVANAALAAIQEEPVTYRDGDTVLKGFVVYDDASKTRRPGIIVVHEWWGINQHMRDEARRYAGAGYTAFVADMYGDGKTADNPKDAGAMVGFMKKNPALMNSRVNAAKDALSKNDTVDASKIGAAGYSFGGTVVLDMVRADSDLKGAVVFYSMLAPSAAPAQAGKVKARVLVLNGGADPFAKPESVDAFNKEMTDARVDYRYVSYPDVKHAYSNPEATEKGKQFGLPFAYSAEATTQANAEASKFFSEVFK